jgi:hypothetical protein
MRLERHEDVRLHVLHDVAALLIEAEGARSTL